MEALIVLMVLAFALVPYVGFVLALRALSVNRRQELRIQHLERALSEMKGWGTGRKSAGDEEAPAVAEAAYPAPPQPAEESPVPTLPAPHVPPMPVAPNLPAPPSPTVADPVAVTAAAEVSVKAAAPSAATEHEAAEPPPRETAAAEPSPAVVPPPPPAAEAEPDGGGVDWERWIGVRGAAALGGLVLALAGIFLFKYAIEQGLLSPPVRVVLGVILGLGCLGGSQLLRRRDLGPAADALAGGGVVCLYATFWAAHRLYGLIGAGFSFVLLGLVTAGCCLLAATYRSRLIALLGLAGGFTAPLLIASPLHNPLSLFAYLLILDAGLLVLAWRRRWPVLGVLSLGATALHQAFFLLRRMRPEEAAFGLAMLVVFAGLFLAFSRRAPAGERSRWLLSTAGAVLLPFGLATLLLIQGGPRLPLLPLGLFLLLLSAAACWIARRQGEPWLGLGAAAGVVAILGLWLLQGPLSSGEAWGASVLSLALAGLFQVFLGQRRQPENPLEVSAEGEASDDPSPQPVDLLPAALTATVGLLLAWIFAGAFRPFWPQFTSWAGLAALLLLSGRRSGRGGCHAVAAAGLGLGLTTFFLRPGPMDPGALASSPPFFLALCGVLCLALRLHALSRDGAPDGRGAEHAAALLPLVLLGMLLLSGDRDLPGGLLLGAAVGFGAFIALSAARLGSGPWYLGGALATVLAPLAHLDTLQLSSQTAKVGLFWMAVAVVFWTFTPFLASGLRQNRLAWSVAALAGGLWFFPLKALYVTAFGTATIGLLPLTLAGLGLAAATRARRQESHAELRHRHLVWFLAVTLGFVSIAIPLQLDREWLTLGWALEGLALVALWRRLDHPGLKYLAAALLGVVSVRLVLNPAVSSYHPAGAWPVLNWLAYTYLVPAAALLLSLRLLLPLEVARVRPREAFLYRHGKPLVAVLCGSAAILVLFAWINLTIFDAFGRTPAEAVDAAQGFAARDLVLSLAWALYALLLMVVGFRRDIAALRHTALGFLLLTLCKVFLYDLGELGDLYRVASLLGLAVSLILVSIAYQRLLVARRPDGSAETSAPSGEATP